MRVEVCRPLELGAAEVERWRELQRSHPTLAHPFLSPGFARAVDSVRPDARVAVVSDGPEVTGFLAFGAGRVGTAGPIGGRLNDLQAVVHHPDRPLPLGEVVHAAGLRAWCFRELLAAQAPAQAPHKTAESPVAVLDGGYRDWFRTAHRRFAADCRRKLRRLEERSGGVTFADDDRSPDTFAAFLRLKQAQYARQGWVDVLALPWVGGLFEALRGEADPGSSLRLAALHAGGRPVALELGLCSERIHMSWFPTYDPDHAAASPGALLTYRLLTDAEEAGAGLYDFGVGDGEHKRRFANAGLLVTTGAVHGRPPLARPAATALYWNDAWRAGRVGRVAQRAVEAARTLSARRRGAPAGSAARS